MTDVTQILSQIESGEVFVAWDEELNREVAIKEIQPQYADNAVSRSRFLLEAEVTGGTDTSSGETHATCDSVEFRRLLGRFVDVCNAIEYAHSRGVLHRELKPGNVMLGKYGETLVVDWGLAKAVGRRDQGKCEGETTLHPNLGSGIVPTQMGSVIGTPAFMSPEQAAGRLDDLGPASDVFSLGATLYYLLVGAPPVVDKDLKVILRKVQTGEFDPPRSIDHDVPKALDAICLKAMSEPQPRIS